MGGEVDYHHPPWVGVGWGERWTIITHPGWGGGRDGLSSPTLGGGRGGEMGHQIVTLNGGFQQINIEGGGGGLRKYDS